MQQLVPETQGWQVGPQVELVSQGTQNPPSFRYPGLQTNPQACPSQVAVPWAGRVQGWHWLPQLSIEELSAQASVHRW